MTGQAMIRGDKRDFISENFTVIDYGERNNE